jgi:hypothetical protein
MKNFGAGPGVGHVDRHQHVGCVGLGVVHIHDPVAVVVEDPRIEQLVLTVVLAASAIPVQQLLVGKRPLWIMVAPAVPGVAGYGIAVPPVLLDVLAVIGLRTGEPERPLLQYRVTPRSTARALSTTVGRRRRTRQARPRPTGRRASVRDHAADSSTRRRRRCSLRGLCPTVFR